MELIHTEQIRLSEKEKNILDSAFYIIKQLNEQTTDYDLTIITDDLLGGLTNLEEYYE